MDKHSIGLADSAMGTAERLVVAGIGTDVGKTLISAILCLGLDADYWKPVQSGRLPETDMEWVKRMTGRPSDRFHAEAYCLETPASPHFSAEHQGIVIEREKLIVPQTSQRLVIETAGGLMVPLNTDLLFIDLLEEWRFPVVLVVKTYLGSINHSLLSIEALQRRGIPLAGIVFNDGGRPESEGPILRAAQAPLLGRIGHLERMDAEVLGNVFRTWEH